MPLDYEMSRLMEQAWVGVAARNPPDENGKRPAGADEMLEFFEDHLRQRIEGLPEPLDRRPQKGGRGVERDSFLADSTESDLGRGDRNVYRFPPRAEPTPNPSQNEIEQSRGRPNGDAMQPATGAGPNTGMTQREASPRRRRSTLKVSTKGSTATLNDREFDLPCLRAAMVLRQLVDARGSPVSSKNLVKSAHPKERIDRIIRSLPLEIRATIKSRRGLGYWIDLK